MSFEFDDPSMLDPVAVIESALDGDGAEVPEGYSANALLLRGGGHDHEQELDACGGLLSVYDPVNVVGVAIRNDPAYYARLAARHLESEPTRLGVVDVGSESPTDLDVPVESVSDPGDLTGLGIAVMHFIKQWAGADEPTVVCFDSLTPLLQYAEVDRCYRFLDVTTRRLSQVCAVSHAHINPDAHDDQTVATLGGVFDAVVDLDADGPRVRSG